MNFYYAEAVILIRPTTREDTDDGIYRYRIDRNAPRWAHGCGERRPIFRLLYEDPCAHALLWQGAIIFEARPRLVFPGGSRRLARLSLPTPKHCPNIAVFHPSPTLGTSMIGRSTRTSQSPPLRAQAAPSTKWKSATRLSSSGAHVTAYNRGAG